MVVIIFKWKSMSVVRPCPVWFPCLPGAQPPVATGTDEPVAVS